MDAYTLLTHELNYELKVRGLTVRNDTYIKRKALKRALEQDSLRPNLERVLDNVNPLVEVDELKKSFASVKGLLDDFDGRDDARARIVSRFAHLHGRLRRCTFEDTDENKAFIEYKEDQIVVLMALEVELGEKLAPPQTNAAQVTFSTSQFATEQGVASTPRSSVPVFKWQLQFDGSTKKQSVAAFLERIEEYRIARNTSKEELYNSAVDLFTGHALVWFRSVRSSVRNWDALVSALRRDFLPSDYDDVLWDEIKSRTQGDREKVTIYIAVIENMFSRLSCPPSEDVRIKQIKKNLLPCYLPHITLIKFETVQGLADMCRMLEEAQVCQARSTAKRYTTPLEPDLAYVQVRDESKDSLVPNNGSVNRDDRRRDVKCWNCNKLGHRSYECNMPKSSVFCYGCGQRNVTKPKCTKCSKN